MKKPYPPSARCDKCKRICAGAASNPGNWYCDYCKSPFGVLIKDDTTTTTGFIPVDEKWYSK